MNDQGRLIRRMPTLTVRATALASALIDELGLSDAETRNPSVSSSYRSHKLLKPNQTVLDAQARVCTGPTQTKPLTGEQAFKALDTILRSGERISSSFNCMDHVLY